MQNKIKAHRHSGLTAWLFVLPSLCGVILFVLLPFAETVRRSFCDGMGTQFVGTANYSSVLHNEAFLLASKNTLRFVCFCLPLLLTLSLFVALLLHRPTIRKSSIGAWFKTTFLLPMAIPVASIVLLWQTLFSEKGLLNAILVLLDRTPIDFMGSNAAFWVLIATYLWKNIGYDSILWTTGLNAIPSDQYEAAQVDGANLLQQFIFVTLPGLLPTLLLTAILSLLNIFKVFREAYLVAGAYPQKSIYLLQHLFNNWFVNLDLPRLCAAAVLVALTMLLVILILLKLWGNDETK